MKSFSLDAYPGREIVIDQQKYLYFGGTAYLGIQTDLQFQATLTACIKQYGTNYGASRISNVQLDIYPKAEKHLANWVGSDACITLTSGYLAGQLVSSYFSGKKYKAFYAPNSHSALHLPTNGGKRPKSHITYASLNLAIRQHLAAKKEVTPVVFMDTIDFSGYSYPDFEGLASLPLKDLIVVADDSHGIGVVGESGTGAFQKLSSLNPKELLLCCSLGKALGIQAGAIFGTGSRIKALSETDFFAGASPAAPAFMATLMASKELFEQKRKVLQEHINTFFKGLPADHGLRQIPEHPAFAYNDPQKTAFLKKNGILVTDFNYPNEHTPLTSRIVLSAAHLREDILQLTSLLKSSQ